MSRELSEVERNMLINTLELMRAGHHEFLGPLYDRDGNEVSPRVEPRPVDPDPYLAQIPALLVKEEDICPATCTSCQSLFRWPCGVIRFATEDERKSFKDQFSGGSGDVIAEQNVQHRLLVMVFANQGRLTEMEMC